MESELLRYALKYASLGWRILPVHTVVNRKCSCRKCSCEKPGKHPRIKAWQTKATNEESVIRQWWQTWPTASVAVATGQQSDVFVIDIDGDAGQAALASLMQEHEWVPKTASVKTGRGLHLYFRSPAEAVKSRTAVMPGLDVRGEGGYAIAPPSRHVSGSVYAWHSEDEPLAYAPEWLLDLLSRERALDVQSMHAGVAHTDAIENGTRNSTLFKRACSMRQQGLEIEELEQELMMTNETECEQPLAEEEVKKIAASAAEYPKGPIVSSRKKDESLLRYFQLNVVEWMTDANIVMMTDAQRGRYINLLAACWPEGGILPNDPAILHKLARASCGLKPFINDLKGVIAPFEKVGERGEWLRHPKLAEQFEVSNKHYQQRIQAGRASWKKKQQEALLKSSLEVEA